MYGISLRKHYAQIMFILLIFMLFTFSGISALLLSINSYRGIVTDGTATSDYRNRVSYIREVVRQHDVEGGVESRMFQGVHALKIDISEDYVEYIYVYDGYLRELLTKKGADIALSAGEKLIEAKSLEINEDIGALDIILTGTDGRRYRSTVSVKAGADYEEF